MTDREVMRLALEALESYQSEMSVQMFDAAITALRQALEHSSSDSAKHSADSADSFCQQELYNLQSVAGRMALELECLLLDTKDLAVVSRWWDTGMEALQAYRDHIWSITHGKDGEEP